MHSQAFRVLERRGRGRASEREKGGERERGGGGEREMDRTISA